QGRAWIAPPGAALLMSLVLRQTAELLPLAAAVAVAEAVGPEAMIKWPNDILVDGRKVAGILIERRQHEDWSVLGIGVDIAIRAFPPELAATAGSLGLSSADVEPFLRVLLDALRQWLETPAAALLEEWQRKDVLRGLEIAWSDGQGTAKGVDERGQL